MLYSFSENCIVDFHTTKQRCINSLLLHLLKQVFSFNHCLVIGFSDELPFLLFNLITNHFSNDFRHVTAVHSLEMTPTSLKSLESYDILLDNIRGHVDHELKELAFEHHNPVILNLLIMFQCNDKLFDYAHSGTSPTGFALLKISINTAF